MQIHLKNWLPILFLMLLVHTVVHAQVDPEIQLGARGVFSFNTDIVRHQTTTAVNDFSDTGILLGFRQKLYHQFRGQMVIGFQFPDAESDLGQLFFHQTFIKVENQTNILKLGRTRVQSMLIEFPTLRDDDALQLTDVLNPFSTGENTEDNQYGNVIELAHIFHQRFWFRIHGEHFTQTPIPPATSEQDFSLNAIGISLQYRVPGTQIWNRPFLQQIGLGMNNFLTNRQGYNSFWNKSLQNFIFSTILNLKPDPIHFVDFRFQAIINQGFSEIRGVSNFKDLTRARSYAIFSSVRYLLRKLERPSLQIALSGGFKTFPGLTNSTSQHQAILNIFYRIGDNFDAAIQFQYKQFTGDLINLYGENETRIQFGLVYNISQSWNNQFDDRESLLNLEHGYIP